VADVARLFARGLLFIAHVLVFVDDATDSQTTLLFRVLESQIKAEMVVRTKKFILG
jgi:hypothetical protein